MTDLSANHGKRLSVEIDGRAYARIPVKTHVIVADDDIVDAVCRYAGHLLHSGDMLMVSEKIVAITQHRAYPIDQIEPSRLARFPLGSYTSPPMGLGWRTQYDGAGHKGSRRAEGSGGGMCGRVAKLWGLGSLLPVMWSQRRCNRRPVRHTLRLTTGMQSWLR